MRDKKYTVVQTTLHVLVVATSVVSSCTLKEAMFLNLTMDIDAVPAVDIAGVVQCDEEVRVAYATTVAVPLLLLRMPVRPLHPSDGTPDRVFWGTLPQARHLLRLGWATLDGPVCPGFTEALALLDAMFLYDVYSPRSICGVAAHLVGSGLVTVDGPMHGMGYKTLLENGASSVAWGSYTLDMSDGNERVWHGSRRVTHTQEKLALLGWQCSQPAVALCLGLDMSANSTAWVGYGVDVFVTWWVRALVGALLLILCRLLSPGIHEPAGMVTTISVVPLRYRSTPDSGSILVRRR
jgi:hypothetical protein